MKQSPEQEFLAIPSLMSYFSLSAPTAIVPVKEGISNHNYYVRTVDGEYIVKFLIHQTVEQVENDVAIQRQLQQGNIHTSAYLQGNNGAYIYQNDDLKAVISRKIEGVTPRTTSPHLVEAFGRVLAGFHTCVIKLPHPNAKGLLNPRVSGIQSDIFSHALPKGVIYGDFHLGNALIDPQQKGIIAAIFDFEDAGENLFLVDLAVTLLSVCFSADENRIDPDLIQAALRGYQSIRALSRIEQFWFPVAIQYAGDTWIKWFIDHGYERYATKHRVRLNSFKEIDVAWLFESSDG